MILKSGQKVQKVQQQQQQQQHTCLIITGPAKEMTTVITDIQMIQAEAASKRRSVTINPLRGIQLPSSCQQAQ
jgi:hypothetical protein